MLRNNPNSISDWHGDVVRLHDILGKYVDLFEDTCPKINLCIPRKNGTIIHKKNLTPHTDQICQVIRWKSHNNTKVYDQILHDFFERHQQDIFKYFGMGFQFTPMNCNVLQQMVRASDHQWREFTKHVHSLVGFQLFASRRNTAKLRKELKPRTHDIISLSLVKDKVNQYNPNKTEKFLLSTIRETEVMAQCFDNFVNNNKWIFYDSYFPVGRFFHG